MSDFKVQLAQNQATIDELESKLSGMRDLQPAFLTQVASGMQTLSHTFKSYKELQGHFGKVYAMDWGPDEKTLLSAAQDGTLILWNPMTNNKLNLISLKSAWVMSCGMSPSGGLAASGGLDNIVTLHKVDTADPAEPPEVARLQEHSGYLSGVAFLDDTQVLTSSGDGTCMLWDINARKLVHTFEGHGQDVMDVSLLPHSDNLFVTGSCDATCKVWDHRAKNSHVLTFYGHSHDINTVDTSRKGNFFVSAGDDSKIIIHDLRSYGPIHVFPAADDSEIAITSVAFSHSSRIVFAGYDDTQCMAHDILTGQPMGLLEAHRNRVSCLGINKSGNALCTGGWDNCLRIWC